MITDVEARVLASIDERWSAELLVDLVRVPSITGSDAESELQHACVAHLREADMDTDVWKLDLDALRADPRFPGTEAPRLEGYGVVGRPARPHGGDGCDPGADPAGSRRRRPDGRPREVGRRRSLQCVHRR